MRKEEPLLPKSSLAVVEGGREGGTGRQRGKAETKSKTEVRQLGTTQKRRAEERGN